MDVNVAQLLQNSASELSDLPPAPPFNPRIEDDLGLDGDFDVNLESALADLKDLDDFDLLAPSTALSSPSIPAQSPTTQQITGNSVPTFPNPTPNLPGWELHQKRKLAQAMKPPVSPYDGWVLLPDQAVSDDCKCHPGREHYFFRCGQLNILPNKPLMTVTYDYNAQRFVQPWEKRRVTATESKPWCYVPNKYLHG